jgi:hypothetical protein
MSCFLNFLICNNYITFYALYFFYDIYIYGKQFHLHDLQNHVSFCRINKQLQSSDLQKKINDFQNKIEQQICSDLPNAFWKRKQHIVDLPYEDTFLEKLIPIKARPIQMNADLEQYCRLETTF